MVRARAPHAHAGFLTRVVRVVRDVRGGALVVRVVRSDDTAGGALPRPGSGGGIERCRRVTDGARGGAGRTGRPERARRTRWSDMRLPGAGTAVDLDIPPRPGFVRSYEIAERGIPGNSTKRPTVGNDTGTRNGPHGTGARTGGSVWTANPLGKPEKPPRRPGKPPGAHRGTARKKGRQGAGSSGPTRRIR
ncbi:hypothetical protein GCM10023324_47550 [Streptomyces youssoufiensis]